MCKTNPIYAKRGGAVAGRSDSEMGDQLVIDNRGIVDYYPVLNCRYVYMVDIYKGGGLMAVAMPI